MVKVVAETLPIWYWIDQKMWCLIVTQCTFVAVRCDIDVVSSCAYIDPTPSLMAAFWRAIGDDLQLFAHSLTVADVLRERREWSGLRHKPWFKGLMTCLWAVYGHFGDLGGHFVRLKSPKHGLWRSPSFFSSSTKTPLTVKLYANSCNSVCPFTSEARDWLGLYIVRELRRLWRHGRRCSNSFLMHAPAFSSRILASTSNHHVPRPSAFKQQVLSPHYAFDRHVHSPHDDYAHCTQSTTIFELGQGRRCRFVRQCGWDWQGEHLTSVRECG